MASWFSKNEHEETPEVVAGELVLDSPKEPGAVDDIESGPSEPNENEGATGLSIPADATDSSSSLALLSQAHRAIAEARSLDEIKGIRDKAEAARKYAQAAGMGLEIQNYAAEVKLRAERRAGQLLAKLKLHGGDRREATADERVTLDEIGVTKDQSSRWQLTAAVPEKSFERYVSETRQEQGEVTTAGLVRIAREIRAKERNRAKAKAQPEPVIDFKQVDSLNTLCEEGKRFACVYADLPWVSDAAVEGSETTGLEHFLNSMKEMPIQNLVEDAAHIHLWATNETLFAAKQVMEAWGFVFKACLLCLSGLGKQGEYWVEAHEFLLLGVRGELPLMERTMNSFMRVERAPDGCPAERVRKIIERVSPGPYLELFGRTPASGWTIYSNFIKDASNQSDAEKEKGGEHGEAACA